MQYRFSISNQFSFFVLTGLAQFCVDIMLFSGLYGIGVTVLMANVMARCCAAILGFMSHKYMTFRRAQSVDSTLDSMAPGRRCFFKFAVWWVLSTSLSSGFLLLIEQQLESTQWLFITKVGVEMFLALVSFFVFRQWVFATVKHKATVDAEIIIK